MSYIEALKALEDWQRGVTGKRRRHPGHAEDDLQMQCVRWFRLQFPQLSRLLHLPKWPGAGMQERVRGSRRWERSLAFPDLILLVASQDYHALLIELKTRTGRQQDSQKDYQKASRAQGYKYVVVRSLEQFMAEMKAYLIVSD